MPPANDLPPGKAHITYNIDCGNGRHPLMLEVSMWGAAKVVLNLCDTDFAEPAGYGVQYCHRLVEEHLRTVSVYRQHFYAPEMEESLPNNLPKKLTRQLARFWTTPPDETARVAHSVLHQPGFCDASTFDRMPPQASQKLADALRSPGSLHRWAAMFLIEHCERADLAPALRRALPRLRFELALYGMVVLERFGARRDLPLLCEWAQRHDVIAPLRERFISRLSTFGDPAAIPCLITLGNETRHEWRPGYPPVQGLPSSAETALANLFIGAQEKPRDEMVQFVAEVFLDKRSQTAAVFERVAERNADSLAIGVELLSHFRWRVRQGAVKLLGHLGDARASAPLLDLLRPPRPGRSDSPWKKPCRQ